MTPKQKAFCDYYLISLNATEAAKKAGYSQKTAYAIGEENLRKPEIKSFIDERLNKLDKQRFLTLEECLKGLSDIAENSKNEIRDRILAYNSIMKRYPIETLSQDNKLEIIIKKASEIEMIEDDK